MYLLITQYSRNTSQLSSVFRNTIDTTFVYGGCTDCIKQHANKPNLYAIKRLIYVSLLQYKDTEGILRLVCSRNRQYSSANDRTQTTAIVSIDLNEIVY